MTRLREYLKTAEASNVVTVQKLASDQALKLVQAGSVEDHVVFDAAEAGRLGLTLGQTVGVTPTDTGKRTLRALTCARPYLSLVTHRNTPFDCRYADRAEQRGSGHSGQGDLCYAPPRPFPPPRLFHPGAL